MFCEVCVDENVVVGVLTIVRAAISAGSTVSVVAVLRNDDSCERRVPPESDAGSGAKFAVVDCGRFESEGTEVWALPDNALTARSSCEATLGEDDRETNGDTNASTADEGRGPAKSESVSGAKFVSVDGVALESEAAASALPESAFSARSLCEATSGADDPKPENDMNVATGDGSNSADVTGCRFDVSATGNACSRNPFPEIRADEASRRDIGREEISAVDVAGVTFVVVVARRFNVCGPLTSPPATLDDGTEDAVIIVSLGSAFFRVRIGSSVFDTVQSFIGSA
jgi:hypothetical protein